MIKYQKINKEHFLNVNKIWLNGLSDNIYGLLGGKFIKEYLNLIFKIKKNKGFVALDKDKVVGFIIFGNDKEINTKILYKNLTRIFLIFLKKVFLLKINDVIKFIDILLYLIFLKIYKLNFKNSKELLIIVIKKSYRSKGIGKKLINKSISSLKKDNKKLKYINVVTLAKFKLSINFYKKNQFIIKRKFFNRYYLSKKI